MCPSGTNGYKTQSPLNFKRALYFNLMKMLLLIHQLLLHHLIILTHRVTLFLSNLKLNQMNTLKSAAKRWLIVLLVVITDVVMTIL